MMGEDFDNMQTLKKNFTQLIAFFRGKKQSADKTSTNFCKSSISLTFSTTQYGGHGCIFTIMLF